MRRQSTEIVATNLVMLDKRSEAEEISNSPDIAQSDETADEV